ncbi:hypothetical protein N7510_004513 [Penicillium lagena]|uniref:uncharacterized protein n=1 Tax=Penicillium lagena TaxID=94218 RepID=UPI0025418700|nr:uncharacterized protein N7510_004513 [Penicillium lagena]KAJ5620529.1 hypothetical protein N7510_004513 [Penicillium lagena]
MMPSLLGLPLEVLMQIVQQTIPAEFEATALSCKALFAASTPFRAQDEEQDEEVLNSLEAEVPAALRNLVLTSPFIEHFGGDPDDWIQGIQQSGIYADVFLLTLLSQVRRVTLYPRWDELDPCQTHYVLSNKHLWPVLKQITYQAKHSEEFPGAPLSMLSTIESSRDFSSDEKSPLTPFVPFLAINSISEVSLVSCVFYDDGYTGMAFDPLVECYSTNLRTLNVDASVAGPKELSQLLSRIPNLEIFRFSHQTKHHGCGYLYNFGAFLDTVQNICGKTLKELSVRLIILESGGSKGATLVDMTRFQKLAVLGINIEMLCGPPYDSSMRDLDAEEIESVGSPAWPKLINMLPVSIEKVNLYLDTFEDDYLKCISHLVEDLPEARVTKLPCLDKLSLFVHSTIPDKALEVLNAAKRSGFSILKDRTSKPLL